MWRGGKKSDWSIVSYSYAGEDEKERRRHFFLSEWGCSATYYSSMFLSTGEEKYSISLFLVMNSMQEKRWREIHISTDHIPMSASTANVRVSLYFVRRTSGLFVLMTNVTQPLLYR